MEQFPASYSYDARGDYCGNAGRGRKEWESIMLEMDAIREMADGEHFMDMIERDRFDYTFWRREYFDKMDLK